MFPKMMHRATAAALSLAVLGSSQAMFVDANLTGTTDFDAWDELSRSTPQVATAAVPFPGFATSASPWPEAIESVLTQGTNDPFSGPFDSDDDPTGDATFNKVSGFGYPAGGSIYSTPFGNGTYAVEDLTPVANIETVVFQIQIGRGTGTGFGKVDQWLDGETTLTVNGTDEIAASNISRISSGVGDSQFGPINIGVLGFQWDLRNYIGQVNSISVGFTPSGTSTTILALQLDQSDVFTVAPIPEPASLALMGIGTIAIIGRRKRV